MNGREAAIAGLAAGFFDDDWTFLDPDLAGRKDIKLALATATFTCVGDILPSAS